MMGGGTQILCPVASPVSLRIKDANGHPHQQCSWRRRGPTEPSCALFRGTSPPSFKHSGQVFGLLRRAHPGFTSPRCRQVKVINVPSLLKERGSCPAHRAVSGIKKISHVMRCIRSRRQKHDLLNQMVWVRVPALSLARSGKVRNLSRPQASRFKKEVVAARLMS